MTSNETDTLSLIPGPGPLAWLHPELQVLRGSAIPPGTGGEGWLDLGSEGLTGDALVRRIREMAPRSIEIQNGPRGHTLWLWLSQVLRTEAIELHCPSHQPAPAPPGTAMEDLLFQAAHGTDSGSPVLCSMEDASRFVFDDTLLTREQAEIVAREQAGEKPVVWVLPFFEAPDLLDTINHTIDKVSEAPESFRSARLIPIFITQLPENSDLETDPGAAAETRLLPSWWGLLPGDRWPQPVRAAFHKLFRLLCPERYFRFAAFENYALTGIDAYMEGVMDRAEAIGPLPEFKSKPLVIGICGTDGSGKSSHVAALKSFLSEQGLAVEVHKIYRHGVFHDTVTDLTRQCAGGRNLHLWRLQRIVKVFDSMKYLYSSLQKPLSELDVVIFDRYVFTHFAAGVGRYHHDPFARELLKTFPKADRVFLLDVPTDEALRRIGTRDEKTVDENNYMLSRYRHALCDLSDRYGFMKLDSTAPIEHNRNAIVTEVTRLLRDRGLLKGDA